MRNAAQKIRDCSAINASPAAPAIISTRDNRAETSSSSPAPMAWLASPAVPMRRKPKIQ